MIILTFNEMTFDAGSRFDIIHQIISELSSESLRSDICPRNKTVNTNNTFMRCR